jgi:hypothetical protein
LNIDDYDAYIGNYTPECKRGVILYIKNSLSSQRCDSLSDHRYKEAVWVDIKLKGDDRLLVGCVYRSPDKSTVENNQALLDLLCKASDTKPTHLVTMGDFNLRSIDWSSWTADEPESHFVHDFLEGLRDNFYHQHVDRPTRYRHNQEPSLLDLVLTSDENLVSDIRYRPPVGKSDHIVLTFCVECYIETQSTVTKLNYHKGNYIGLREALSGTNWDIAFDKCSSVNEMWDTFTNLLGEAVSTHVPQCKGQAARKPKPVWLNRDALSKTKKKKKAWQKYIKTKNYSDFQEYVRHRNHATAECKLSKKTFERNLAIEVNDNPKAFWKYVSSKTRTRTGIGDLLKEDNTMTATALEKADVLNKFFCSVFTKEERDNAPTLDMRPFDTPLCDTQFSVKEVSEKLASLNPTKSAGPDGLHPRVLKECSDQLAEPLYAIMRRSLDTGVVPDAWREANISAIFKKGRKQDAGNYRPISLTSIVCKMFEGIIRRGLIAHMDSNNLFTEHQHGFRDKRSTVTQLIEVLDNWTRALDDGKCVDVIYLDFQKAFDTVPHIRLMNKLEAYGIDGKVRQWIGSFLSNRRQRVCVNGIYSEWAAVTSGIPQGSVLGPVLFVVFINDMPEVVSSICKLFADDTKVYRDINTTDDNLALQDDLYHLSDWSDKWLLKFNNKKCKRMHIGGKNEKFEYKLCRDSANAIEETLEEKDLGVIVEPDLSFRKHISTAVNKANKIVGVIKRTFDYRENDIINKLYCSLVRPHLEYANSVWAPYLRKDINSIENVQRRATKIIPGLADLPYESRLTSLRLFSLAYRRRRGDMIRVYKMLHGLEKISSDIFTLANSDKTRGHSLKLTKSSSKRNVRHHFFASRIINDWNGLPESIVSANSVNIFKYKLDSHWKDYHYQY